MQVFTSGHIQALLIAFYNVTKDLIKSNPESHFSNNEFVQFPKFRVTSNAERRNRVQALEK